MVTLRIHLQKVAPLTVGAFKNLNEAENRIKEILKEGFYKTNGVLNKLKVNGRDS